MAVGAILPVQADIRRRSPGDCAMAFTADREVLFDRLDEELRFASQPAPDLFAKIIASVCSRIPILTRSGKTTGIDRLIESGAWTDCALTLLELELPMWKIRRLAFESGEWLCSLSQRPNLPLEFDDCVDASHEMLALAILRAFVGARRNTSSTRPVTSRVPQLLSLPADAICCDNFA
jgi:hypothetical protein